MAPAYDKLIAVDLDGTLLQPDNTITGENLSAVREAERHGAIVVVVTGRPYVSADSIARRFDLPKGPLVSFNGAVIRQPRGGKLLFQRLVPADLTMEVVEECIGHNLHLHFYLDDELFVSQYDDWARLYCERTEMSCRAVADMRDFAGKEAIKLLVVDRPETIDGYFQVYSRRWQHRLYVTRSMAEYIEFLSPQASKGHALDWLIDYYQVDRAKTLAIGDALNDLPLLERAGAAVAMPAAGEELKAVAQFVPPNQETGVAAAINWFLARR